MLEKESLILEDIYGFIQDSKACFGDIDSMWTTINEIQRLCKGNFLALTNLSNFHLLARDIPWDEGILMDQFHIVLHNDIKDLVVTFPEDPKSLMDATTLLVQFDNLLFGICSEYQQMTRLRLLLFEGRSECQQLIRLRLD